MSMESYEWSVRIDAVGPGSDEDPETVVDDLIAILEEVRAIPRS